MNKDNAAPDPEEMTSAADMPDMEDTAQEGGTEESAAAGQADRKALEQGIGIARPEAKAEPDEAEEPDVEDAEEYEEENEKIRYREDLPLEEAPTTQEMLRAAYSGKNRNLFIWYIILVAYFVILSIVTFFGSVKPPVSTVLYILPLVPVTILYLKYNVFGDQDSKK